MAKVHVWMLYRGGPTEPSQLDSYFQTQMKDPHLLGLGRNVLSRLWMKLLSWWRGKDTARFRLTGPCPSHSRSNEQSSELNRVLGSDYSCTNVHRYDGTSAEDRLKETPRNITVLLLPLVPFRSGVLYSALSEARKRLEREGISYVEAPPLSHSPSFLVSYAESIRESIISLQGSRAYTVLLLFSRDALNWKKAEPELLSEIQSFCSGIQQQLHQDITIITALHSSEAVNKLKMLEDTDHILYGYPAWTCDSYEELPVEISQQPFTFHQIPRLNNRPSFIRMLTETVLQHSPLENPNKGLKSSSSS